MTRTALAFLFSLTLLPAGTWAQGHARPVESLAFSGDGKRLASGAQDGATHVYRVADGQRIQVAGTGQILVSELAFTPFAAAVLSAGWDGRLVIWPLEAPARRQVYPVQRPAEPITAVAMTRDGGRVATGHLDRTVRLWDPGKREVIQTVRFKQAVPECLAFSRDGASLAVGTRMGKVRVWQVEPWKRLAEFDAAGRVSQVRFTPDGKQLVVGAGQLEWWALDGPERLKALKTQVRGSDYAITPNARVVAALGRRDVVAFAVDGEAKKLPRRGRPTAIATDPNGQTLAVGYADGAIDLYDVASGERRVEILSDPTRPRELDAPKGAPDALAGKNLLDMRAADWAGRSQTGGLLLGEQDADKTGIRFRALSTPAHMTGRDYCYLPVGLGTRSFELQWQAVIDHNGGPGMFWSGVTVGVSTAPPFAMDANDLAAVMTIHYPGVFAGASAGEPYKPYPGNSHFTAPRLARGLGMTGQVPKLGFSREALGTFSTGKPIVFQLRRDPCDVMTFTAFCPHAGQTAQKPWFSRAWKLPEDQRDKALKYVFVKRLPTASVHLGYQETGYGEAFRLVGELTEMHLRLDPPILDGLPSWDGPVCRPGQVLTLVGANFAEGVKVLIGGVEAPGVQRSGAETLTCRVPDLPAGRRYELVVANPNGTSFLAPVGLPVGRLLEDISLPGTMPAGGETVTLRGQGFTDKTKVFFGRRPAEVVKVVDATAMQVRVPAGEAGFAPVTAREGDSPFAGQLEFGYMSHPSVYFDAEALAAFRQRLRQPPAADWVAQVAARADGAARQNVSRRHGGAGRNLPPLLWGYALTGDANYVQPLRRWMLAVADSGVDLPEEAEAWCAAAYDLLAPKLSVQDRSKVLNYLLATERHFLELHRRGDWYTTSLHSFNPRTNASALVVSLAVRGLSTHTDEVVAAVKQNLLHYIETAFGPDGGSIEGMSWGTWGLREYLRAAGLLFRHGHGSELREHPRLRGLAHLYRTMLASPKEFCRFGNMHGGLKGLAVAGMVAPHVEQDGPDPLPWVMHALASDIDRDEVDEAALTLWAGAEVADRIPMPTVPRISVLRDIQWGIMRSDPRIDAPLVVGVKGSDGHLPYHSQKDVGSFVLYAHGRELIRDPGWGSMKAAEHSIPVIDGAAGDSSGGFITATHARGPWRAMLLDATHNREGWGIRRFARTLVTCGRKYVIVLDDIVPAEGKPGRVTSRFQMPEVQPAAEPAGAVTTDGNASLRMRLFGPEVKLGVKDHKRGVHWRGKWQSLKVDYTADANRPLVTVFAVADGNEPPALDAKVEYGERKIVVRLPNGETANFSKREAGWAYNPPFGPKAPPPAWALTGPARPRPRAKAIPAEKAPVLDGNLGEAVWQQAPAAGGFVVNETWAEDRSAKYPTEFRFAYDKDHLYMAVRCYDPNLEGLVTEMAGPAQGAGGDDHVTVYIDPGFYRQAGRFGSWNFTAAGRDTGAYHRSGDMGKPIVTVRSGREPAGPSGRSAWTLEAAWPWEAVLHDSWQRDKIEKVRPGHRMGLNLTRHRAGPPVEHSVWSRCYAWPASRPWRWGVLIFE